MCVCVCVYVHAGTCNMLVRRVKDSSVDSLPSTSTNEKRKKSQRVARTQGVAVVERRDLAEPLCQACVEFHARICTTLDIHSDTPTLLTHTYSPSTPHSHLHQCLRRIVTFLYFCRGSTRFCQMFATHNGTNSLPHINNTQHSEGYASRLFY